MKKTGLALITFLLSQVLFAQKTFVSPEIRSYMEVIEKCNTSPVDYVMGLFEKYDVVVLQERDHRDTTQYHLIRKIISDPRFIDKVGNILTEVGMYHTRDKINHVLQSDYANEAAFEKALAEVEFDFNWNPMWEKSNMAQFHTDIYRINKKLPAGKKINLYPTDVQFSWTNKTISHNQFQRFLDLMTDSRDRLMGNNAVDALCKIFEDSASKKKALVIYNMQHACLNPYPNGSMSGGSPHGFIWINHTSRKN